MFLTVTVQAQSRQTSKVLDVWANIGTNTVREGTTQSINSWQTTTLYIAHAMGTKTAHGGTDIYIQMSPLDTGDDTWFTQGSFTLGVGTASSTILDVTPSVGSTTILLGTTTTRMEADNLKYLLLLDSGTVSDSQLLNLVSHSADTSITILDGLTSAPSASSTVWDFAEAIVYTLPRWGNRVRVVYDNTSDPSGADVYTYSAIFGNRP